MAKTEPLVVSGPSLGDKVRDKITGFSGTITAACQYITGCSQFLVQPPTKSDGEFVESRWFDVDRLEVIDEPKLNFPVETNGADKPAPRK